MFIKATNKLNNNLICDLEKLEISIEDSFSQTYIKFTQKNHELSYKVNNIEDANALIDLIFEEIDLALNNSVSTLDLSQARLEKMLNIINNEESDNTLKNDSESQDSIEDLFFVHNKRSSYDF